jgi:hypothetical protein
MTPKEKAKELVSKYLRTYPIYNNPTVVISYTHNEAKQCALIAIDEIINFGNQLGIREPMMYWNKVKEEIENL